MSHFGRDRTAANGDFNRLDYSPIAAGCSCSIDFNWQRDWSYYVASSWDESHLLASFHEQPTGAAVSVSERALELG